MSDAKFFQDFDRYCEENGITPEEAPMAFAAFLNRETGWDGEATKVDPSLCAGGCDFDAEGCWHSRNNGTGPCCEKCEHVGTEADKWK